MAGVAVPAPPPYPSPREGEGGRRRAFSPNWRARLAFAALALYALYAAQSLDFTWSRFVQGFDQGGRFLARMFPPNTAPDKLQLLVGGMMESLQIAVLATAVGIALSLPLAVAAARNLAPAPLAWSARALIVLFRSFHPVIVAILFVKAVGFGALAGVLALIVASLGFLSKLLAEALEEISMRQLEAVRATGAPFLSVLVLGVLPQVLPRHIGFCAYQLDSNLRNSALVGMVGGGGIGATLFTAFQRFDYDFVLTIVLAIIAVVMLGEMLSVWTRRLFQ
jgi:phosphonate ABC transporter permease subunit PhnE